MLWPDTDSKSTASFPDMGLQPLPKPLNSGIWDFPEMRGTLFWGPYSKDPTI